VRVERVLPAQANLTAGEADAILEAAYLATVADGHLSGDEEGAFRAVMARLRALTPSAGAPKPVTDTDMARTIERFAVRLDHAARIERIAVLRLSLERPDARHLAYKVAFAMSLADLEASDEEADFDEELIEAFGLTEDQAAALEGEVYEALDADAGIDTEEET
jgi:hypothetical protein